MVDGENQDLEPELVYTLERLTPARTEAEWAELVRPDWRGRVSELGGEALKAFWAEAVRYARWEIRRYRCWRGQDEPVLADGYDAEGVVQAAFKRLIEWEAIQMQSAECKLQNGVTPEHQMQSAECKLQSGVTPEHQMHSGECRLQNGELAEHQMQSAECKLQSGETAEHPRGGVAVFYSAEDIRRELQVLIKRRVRWLHERSETRLVVGEWDVLPPRPDGELVSIFDYLPGKIARPDEELMRKEKEQFLREFKAGFEATLRRRKELLEVFRRVWEGQKRREVARGLGMEAQRVKRLQGQLRRRLARFGGKTDHRPRTRGPVGKNERIFNAETRSSAEGRR